VTRPPFAVVVLARAQREIDEADRWWVQHHANANDVLDQLRHFFELVAVFPEIGTLVRSSRRVLLPDIEFHVYYRVRPRAERIEILSFWYAGRGTGPAV
jgi:plasmid stabilization system protein ParE